MVFYPKMKFKLYEKLGNNNNDQQHPGNSNRIWKNFNFSKDALQKLLSLNQPTKNKYI